MIAPRGLLQLLPVAPLIMSLALLNGAMTSCTAPPSGVRERAVDASSTPPYLVTAESFQQQMDSAMDVMSHGMATVHMTGDPDRDFALMMIPHHQGAIDMAKTELLYGKNPVLRRLAQEIVVTQGSEIAVMQAELKK